MSVWSAAWRVVDALFGIAMWADERRERRQARRRLAELGAAMDRDGRLERTRAPTVILPRPTSPPAAVGAASPSAPSTPPRRR